MQQKKREAKFFEKLAVKATQASGSTPAIVISFSLIIVWALTGPLFNYSETWQLIINTGTTIITFLMVFLIQKAQNKDSKAVHIKLNELVAANSRASNKMVDVEDLTEQELAILEKFYGRLKQKAQKENSQQSHSIEDHENHSNDDKISSPESEEKQENQA
jgi:low affinity Fe/Cu permease